MFVALFGFELHRMKKYDGAQLLCGLILSRSVRAVWYTAQSWLKFPAMQIKRRFGGAVSFHCFCLKVYERGVFLLLRLLKREPEETGYVYWEKYQHLNKNMQPEGFLIHSYCLVLPKEEGNEKLLAFIPP